jgi:Glyoxalase/Bleomycin resistance protein/Dioxygenase superfamily
MIKRFDRLDIATADLADAVGIYQKNFDFAVRRTTESEEAIIELNGAQIRIQTGAAVADLIASSGEGLAALWLEAEDVEKVADKLKAANVAVSPIRVEGDRRIVEVNPRSANMVPLFIFDRMQH